MIEWTVRCWSGPDLRLGYPSLWLGTLSPEVWAGVAPHSCVVSGIDHFIFLLYWVVIDHEMKGEKLLFL